MGERLKGQEVSVNIVSTTQGLETAFGNVSSLEIQYNRDTPGEDYVGQTTTQFDDVFKGISGTIEFHTETADVFSFIQRLNEVSKNRLPGERIQIVATFVFPVGGSRRLVIPDCKFGNIPISVSGRDEFVGFKLDFVASDANIVAAP